MHEIGRITLLQIQRSSLTLGKRLETYYDPTPLLAVESLRLTPQGVFGIGEDGGEVMDLHHMEHPTTHNVRGVNGVSIGFTSHYQSIRETYGEHLVNGIAGENMLIEADTIVTLKDLGSRLAIALQKTGQFVYLTDFKVATPCVEFSQFAANHGKPLPPDKLKAALQFLNDGRRGFYATVEDAPNELIVHVGDKVFVVNGA
ncbi:MAG: hypothetical protein ACR2H5_12425 [Ktedonobacteraceae bacterium]